MKSTVVVGFFAVSALTGLAQSWTAPGGGSWGDGGNWDGDAVPGGTAPVAFNLPHAGVEWEVALNGDRRQAADLTFGGGDWRIAPGTPADSAFILANRYVTVLDGVTTLAATGIVQTGETILRGGGELRVEAPYLFQEFFMESGSVRVMPGDVFETRSDRDIHIDGTSSLFLEGGTVNTKIVRLGQRTFPTNSLFRMTSGTVNCVGSGGAILLIGYNLCNGMWGGITTAEISGGTYSFTGSEDNAGVFLGRVHHSALTVGGGETAATLNCGQVALDWQANIDQKEVGSVLTIGTNGTVNASRRMLKFRSAGHATVNLQRGGLLRTPTVLSESTGLFDFVFGGGCLELTGTPNALFTGVNMRVAVAADSVLDIGANDVACPAPFSGEGMLTKLGGGALALSGSHADFSGVWDVAAGTLALAGNAAIPEDAAVLLADGTTLDLTAMRSLPAQVSAAGGTTIMTHPENTMIGTLTLGNGTVAVDGDGALVLLALEVSDGVTADLVCTGQVTIAALAGGGTLTVSGGGTFNVIDRTGFSGGTLAVAQGDGTQWNENIDTIDSLCVAENTALNTLGHTLTVGTLTLEGGTLQVTGGGGLTVQNLIAAGTGTIRESAGDVVVGVTSLTIAPDAVFTLETPGTVTVDTVQGSGTFRLVGGTATIATLHSGISFDIEGGEVTATPALASPAAPAFPSGEPAFWVDASDADSFSTVSGRLVWSDTRGGTFTMNAISTNVVPAIVSEPTLGGLNAVKFASPHTVSGLKGMHWDQRLTNIRTVFWVIGAQEGGGQLLGDASLIEFLRGEYPPKHPGASNQLDWPKGIHYAPLVSQNYADANPSRCIRGALARIGGTVIDPLQTGYPHPGYHVVSIRTTNTVSASAFASERTAPTYADRSGCQRLAECIVFTNALTDAEIEATEAYLQRKWFGVDAYAPTVRLDGANARFTAQGGAMRIDELQVTENGPNPVSAVSGVARVEQLTTSCDFALQYDALAANLPLMVQSLRVEDDAAVTVNAQSSQNVWIGQITGQGCVTVAVATAAGALVDVGSAFTLPGESVKLEVIPAVSNVVRSWFGQGGLEVAGASAVNVNFADISGNARLAVTGGTGIPLQMTLLRATGAWTLAGTVDPYIENVFLFGDAGQTWAIDIGGNDLRIKEFYGRNTFRWDGPNQIKITNALRASDGNTATLAAAAFNSPIPNIVIGNASAGITFTGTGDLNVTRFVVEGDITNPGRLIFAPDVSMTVNTFECRPGNNAPFYLPTEGSLAIDSLQMRGESAIVFPANKITAVRSLSTQTDGARLVIRDGILQVTETINTCRNFTVIGGGIIFPDGMTLTPTQFDVRTPARFDLGVGSTFTLAIPGQTFTNDVTFTNGTIAVNESTAFEGVLRLEDTALSVAAGTTLIAPVLSGDGAVTLAAGSSLSVQEQLGFNGTIANEGGTLYISSDRTNSIPSEPVAAPAFWVDASQSGAFETNASGKLVWLDKRTARDSATGMMYATALSNSLPPILQNELNGLPVVDFGKLGTAQKDERGMIWNKRITNVQAVHWVIGAQNGGGQMLGDMNDGGDIDWFRFTDTDPSGDQTYNFGYGDYRTPPFPQQQRWKNRAGRMDYIHNGTGYLNGVQNDGLALSNGFPSAGYHLLSFRTTGPTFAAAFASERVGNIYGGRSGGQRLGEVLVYDAPLTVKQNHDNDAYLTWKWFGKRFEDYRLPEECLLVLCGSGDVSGANVLAREIAPAAAGLSMDGNLYLDAYPAAADVGAVIGLATLPASDAAAVSVAGDVFLPSRVTVVLGEVQTGTFTVLDAGGTIHGSPEWLLDTTAVPGASAFQIRLVQEGNTVLLKISGKGTTLLLR